MCLAWKMLITLGHNVDRKGSPPKIILISDLSFELWHLCKSLLPSAKGLSIYFMLFYFYCWVAPSYTKRQSWEHYCHPYALSIVNVVCIMTGSLLPLITMFSCCLNFGGALHLYFAVWYVSNVSIIFDCSMLLYDQSWMFCEEFLSTLYHFWY